MYIDNTRIAVEDSFAKVWNATSEQVLVVMVQLSHRDVGA